jgi:hypothetical protein
LAWTLHYACLGGNIEIIDLVLEELLRQKTIPNFDQALWGGCRYSDEISDLMIEKGAIKCQNCGWRKDSGLTHISLFWICRKKL